MNANIGEGRYDEAVFPLDLTMYQTPSKHKLAARIIELRAELASTRVELETLKADGVRWVDSMCRFAYGAGAKETAKRAGFTGELPKWPGVES